MGNELDAGQIIDQIELQGRTAILVSFIMPESGIISGNSLSRADIQSMRTDDLADQKAFFKVLKAIGEIGEAGLRGAPRIESGEIKPFELKGDVLGMSLSDFKEKHRRKVNRVTAPFCSSQGPTNEPWHQSAAVVHCMLDSPLEETDRTVGAAPSKMLLYEFVDEKLFRISATFDNDYFERVERSMHQKFGPPIRVESKPRGYVWANPISSIHLMYGGAEQDSGLVFLHEELFALVNERAKLSDPDL